MRHDGYTPSGDSAPREAVERVARMRLTGAARLITLDAGAIWGGDDSLAAAILGKLALLLEREPPRVVVYDVSARQRVEFELTVPCEHVTFERSAVPTDVGALLAREGVAPGACLAIFSMSSVVAPEGCYAFWVSGGDHTPAGAHATRPQGPAATDAILALYGTALAQERAGSAFRAVSQGHDIPAEGHASADIFTGVVRSAARPATPIHAAEQRPLPDRHGLRALAHRAYDRLLRNIQPNGAIVGAPSRGDQPGKPNYWFFWQRDSAAAMRHVIAWSQRPPLGLDARPLAAAIERYLAFVAHTQRRGHLGTSRYTVDGEPILSYGNPQLDGPALSVLAMARLDDPTRAYPQMRAYLDLLASPQGRGPTMGAWELIYGRHFNADVLRRHALLAGAEVASRNGRSDDAERFGAAATRDERVASDFVDERTGRFVAYREIADPWFGAISGLDMTVISALLAVRPVAPADADPDAPSRHLTDLAHPAVLATMLALEEAFAPLYQVNRDWRAGGNLGWGLGRFPEDANDGLGSSGGNPWPLTTLWGAQFYYLLAQDVAARAARAGSPPRIGDARQVAFFNRAANEAIIALDAPIPADVWRERLVPALVARADGYLSFVVHHLPDDGGVTEQIDRETGEPRGAADLSWALAELIATIALHEQAHRAT